MLLDRSLSLWCSYSCEFVFFSLSLSPQPPLSVLSFALQGCFHHIYTEVCLITDVSPHIHDLLTPAPSPSKASFFFLSFFLLLLLLFYSEYMTLYYICSKSTSKKTLHNPLHRHVAKLASFVCYSEHPLSQPMNQSIHQ